MIDLGKTAERPRTLREQKLDRVAQKIFTDFLPNTSKCLC